MPTFRVHFDTGEVFVVDAQNPTEARAKAALQSGRGQNGGLRITGIKLDRSAEHQSRRETRLTRFR